MPPDTEVVPPDTEVVKRIGTAWRELRRSSDAKGLRERLYGQGTDTGSLDPGQVDVLEWLLQRDRWRMRDLATALRVDASTATRAVDRLVAAGLASRRRSSEDGRGVVVAATQSGLERFHEIETKRVALLQELLATWNEDDTDALAALLERLVQAIDTAGEIAVAATRG